MRRACYGVLRFIMESGAKGAEVTKFLLYVTEALFVCTKCEGVDLPVDKAHVMVWLSRRATG